MKHENLVLSNELIKVELPQERFGKLTSRALALRQRERQKNKVEVEGSGLYFLLIFEKTKSYKRRITGLSLVKKSRTSDTIFPPFFPHLKRKGVVGRETNARCLLGHQLWPPSCLRRRREGMSQAKRPNRRKKKR